jgi:hypothetical protein
VNLDDKESVFNRKFFYHAPNHAADFLPKDENLFRALRLIKVSDFRTRHSLSLVMDDEAARAVAYLQPE